MTLAATLHLVTTALVLAIALLHGWFLMLEMFLWRRPLGRRVFHLSPEQAQATAVLAMNQGLYNGFLAAGLVWGAFSADGTVAPFFLACVLIAGVFGGATVNRRIFFVQAAPAGLALAVVALRDSTLILF